MLRYLARGMAGLALAGLLCLMNLPTATAGDRHSSKIIINKGTNQLAVVEDGRFLQVFPVATGRRPSYTPEGVFRVVCKIVNPYYARLKIPGGHPANPLGKYWLGLSLGGGHQYGIHGNADPSSIGKYASGGCIRLHNSDIAWLFPRIAVGTPVEIINSPVSLEMLYPDQAGLICPPPAGADQGEGN